MATIDLRCEGPTLHGRLTDSRWLEVKCNRRACGYAKGKIVLHTIDILTGEVTETKIFADPSTQKRRRHNASHQSSASIRAS